MESQDLVKIMSYTWKMFNCVWRGRVTTIYMKNVQMCMKGKGYNLPKDVLFLSSYVFRFQ
jgi:hypothetical protein